MNNVAELDRVLLSTSVYLTIQLLVKKFTFYFTFLFLRTVLEGISSQYAALEYWTTLLYILVMVCTLKLSLLLPHVQCSTIISKSDQVPIAIFSPRPSPNS